MSEAVVVVDYTVSAAAAAKNVRYIAHREERSAGRLVTVHGIGETFRSTRTAGAASERLRGHGEGLARARYYRLKLTTSDEVASRLSRLGPSRSEEVLNRATQRAVQAVNSNLEGVLAVHGNGGDGRPFGHPHVHVVLSPRYANGLAVMSLPVDRLRAEWARALEREVPVPEATRSNGRDAQHGVDHRPALSPAPAGWDRAPFRGRVGVVVDRETNRRSR